MATYAGSPDPGLLVYRRYLGGIGWLLLVLFTINSYMTYMVAKVNAVTRIWFSAGRDGVLFSRVKGVHPRFGTPHQAVILFLVVILIINMVAGAVLGPTTGAFWLLTVAGVCIIAVHIVANTALTVFTLRHRKAQRFRPLLHGVVPTLATVIGLIVIVFSVYPLPAAPIGSAAVFAVVWLAAGFVVAAYYVRRHPGRMRLAGRSRAAEVGERA